MWLRRERRGGGGFRIKKRQSGKEGMNRDGEEKWGKSGVGKGTGVRGSRG